MKNLAFLLVFVGVIFVYGCTEVETVNPRTEPDPIPSSAGDPNEEPGNCGSC